jgi:protein TonB
MFTNLIESDSHRQEFKRRSSFFLATVAGYALILFAAGIAGILGYDARVEAQTSSLEFLEWVPPVEHVDVDRPRATQPTRRPIRSNAPVDPHLDIPMRTRAEAPVTDPSKIPEDIGIVGPTVPPVTGPVRLGRENLNPPGLPSTQGTCVTCNSSETQPRVAVDNDTPTPVKPKPQRLSSKVLASKAISLPQPPYPMIAKQMGAQGQVNVQILVDETGRVISAQILSGHPTLVGAAKEAALRARFTPTLLNDQPVKVQGVIIYNFVLR